jgi:epoxyqueuosine reductase QueG
MATSTVDKRTKRRFEADPNHFIEDIIEKFVRTSPMNRLEAFEGAPIFEAPLIGFAAGDDPLFATYKEIIHKDHYHPRDMLMRHMTETLKTEAPVLENVSVVSFVLPIHPDTLQSNAREQEGPSRRWNHTRWSGQDFIMALSKHVVAVLEGMGAVALAPELTPFFQILQSSDTLASNWSQRHMAYAAGLGTFSLNDGFITKKGMAMRCGSVVTDVKLVPSARPYAHHLANCLFFATGKCGACIQRCPGGAISEKGHDKAKCLHTLFVQQKPWLDGAHGPGYMGTYAGCGLCQTGVPCEHRIPAPKRRSTAGTSR